jgi:Protein of unknown function (DUF3089)
LCITARRVVCIRRLLIILSLAAVSVASCAGSDASTGTTAGTAATASTTTAVVDTTSPSTTSAEPSTTQAAITTTTAAPYVSEIYKDPAHWICRGDMTDSCDDAAPLTEVAADGTLTVEPYEVAVDPPIDCFYVYPTVSEDPTYNSDLVAGNEIGATDLQAARFNQVCKVYAPIYQSVTLAGLFGSTPGDFAQGWDLAYQGVLDAWRHYLANDNRGRPVVILAHSQGSFHVVRLLREEIDPDPAQRALIASAIIAGTSFQVAPGQDIGGDTKNMPLCREVGQVGCVITFQSYRDSVPPLPGALFGAPQGSTASACVNPAALAGGPGLLDAAAPTGSWVFTDPAKAAAITTPFMGVPGLITAECKVKDGYSYLAITVNGDPADPRADDIPGDGSPNWGLHTVDLSITQETLIDLVRSQATAYVGLQD